MGSRPQDAFDESHLASIKELWETLRRDDLDEIDLLYFVQLLLRGVLYQKYDQHCGVCGAWPYESHAADCVRGIALEYAKHQWDIGPQSWADVWL